MSEENVEIVRRSSRAGRRATFDGGGEYFDPQVMFIVRLPFTEQGLSSVPRGSVSSCEDC
jgi:hypothetical protein